MESPKIPKFAHSIFKWYCREDRYEELHGDLEEIFEERLDSHSVRRAKLLYCWDVILCCQSYARKSNSSPTLSQITMFRSHLKIAYRSLITSKGYAAINILGLAVGIAFSCMLFIYINNELGYDSYHSKSDRTYRAVTKDLRSPENVRFYGETTPMVGPTMVADLPEVEQMTRLFKYTGQLVFSLEDQKFQERSWFAADPSLFEVFDFDFIHGDPTTALSEPNTAIFTETAAIQYFGKTDVVGNLLMREHPLKITAVIKDLPVNTHLQFAIVISAVDSNEEWNGYLSSWNNFGAYTYVVLENKESIESFRGKLASFSDQYFPHFKGMMTLDFQPITDIYLESKHIESGVSEKNGQYQYIYIFLSMGLFVLFIACINYINLATAKTAHRAREIGIRKVIGAVRQQLIGQFLTEAFLVSVISMCLGMIIMQVTFPYFNQITGTNFSIDSENVGLFLPPLVSLTVLIALLSGAYPAFYLSKLLPISTLKGDLSIGNSSVLLRKGLVVFQFALTIVMLTSTLIIGQQMNFIDVMDVGFEKDKMVVIDINNGNVRTHFQSMKNELKAIPGVEQVGVSSRVPGEWKSIRRVYIKNNLNSLDSLRSYFMGFDEGMLETFSMQLESGKFFASNAQNDSTKVLINQQTATILGLTEPIGSKIKIRLRDDTIFEPTIIGVLKDFNFQSLHQKIGPLVIGSWNNPIQSIDYFTLKVSGNMADVIASASVVHEKFDKNTPMEHHYLDQQLERLYVAEAKAGMIFQMSAGISIFVACMGIFGLASFTVNNRKKELGIRKVLGADDSSLFLLLSSGFVKQVGLAFLVAAPITYFAMNIWLESFVYRITIGPDVFVYSGLIAILIVFGTISYRTIMAIKSNPTDQLSYE